MLGSDAQTLWDLQKPCSTLGLICFHKMCVAQVAAATRVISVGLMYNNEALQVILIYLDSVHGCGAYSDKKNPAGCFTG